MKTLAEKIAVMQAFERGEKIEAAFIDSGSWSDSPTPSWARNVFDYRVASKPPEPKYVPWTLATIARPLPNVVMRCIPHDVSAICDATLDGIWVGRSGTLTTYGQLLKYYTTLDGKPCGTLETTK